MEAAWLNVMKKGIRIITRTRRKSPSVFSPAAPRLLPLGSADGRLREGEWVTGCLGFLQQV